LHPDCPSQLERTGEADRGVAYYRTQSTVSAEFKQIEKLLVPIEVDLPNGTVQKTHHLRKRSIKGDLHYELTPKGFETAVVVSRRSLPGPVGHYRSSNLRAVDPKYYTICLAVDLREGGGGNKYRRVLHEMCNKLDMQKIPYFVNTLKIGDYCFFSGDKLCPILVERKSVEDVAKSIDQDDGRWTKQKHRMYHGQFVFGYDNCRMAYIIEGKVEKHLVSNGFVGNARHKVSRELFDREVANLHTEGFEVLRTSCVEHSMFELARWAESVARDVRTGRLEARLTYNEFVEAVRKIPKETDFSRLARYHAKRETTHGAEAEAAQQRKPSSGSSLRTRGATVDLMSDDDDDDDDLDFGLGLRPVALETERLRNPSQKRRSLASAAATRHGIPKHRSEGAQKRFKLDAREGLEEVRRQSFETTAYSYSVIPSGAASARAANPASSRRKDPPPPGSQPRAEEQPEEAKNEYSKWTLCRLREKCGELGMKRSGKKADLVERLMDETNHPPEVFRLRQKRGLYVPTKLDTGATAVLVAIQIQQDAAPAGIYEYAGGTKDELYVLADATDIKKDPFSGGTTQTGPYHYDGWSCMKQLKEPADPPLVIEKKGRYRLSTTGDVSGLKLARAMHIWCHKKGICKCIERGYPFNPDQWKKL